MWLNQSGELLELAQVLPRLTAGYSPREPNEDNALRPVPLGFVVLH